MFTASIVAGAPCLALGRPNKTRLLVIFFLARSDHCMSENIRSAEFFRAEFPPGTSLPGIIINVFPQLVTAFSSRADVEGRLRPGNRGNSQPDTVRAARGNSPRSCALMPVRRLASSARDCAEDAPHTLRHVSAFHNVLKPQCTDCSLTTPYRSTKCRQIGASPRPPCPSRFSSSWPWPTAVLGPRGRPSPSTTETLETCTGAATSL